MSKCSNVNNVGCLHITGFNYNVTFVAHVHLCTMDSSVNFAISV